MFGFRQWIERNGQLCECRFNVYKRVEWHTQRQRRYMIGGPNSFLLKEFGCILSIILIWDELERYEIYSICLRIQEKSHGQFHF